MIIFIGTYVLCNKMKIIIIHFFTNYRVYQRIKQACSDGFIFALIFVIAQAKLK